MAFNSNNASVPTKRSFFLNPVFLIATVAVLAFGFFIVSQIVGTINGAVVMENGIKAQYSSNQNNLGQLSLKVKESLGVARINNEDLERIIRGSLEGRYGSDGEGSKQAMLWVKENYPGQYDPSLMKTVQQTILSGRTDFEVNQNVLIDKVRVYQNQLDFVWSGFWLKMLGFPKIKLDDYKPVISAHAGEAFHTKIDPGFDLGDRPAPAPPAEPKVE